EAANRDLLRAFLVPEGYEVVEAGSGTEALRIVEDGDIDVVLLDVLMPGLNGIEACRRIREDLGRVALPIVLITAIAHRASRIRAKGLGAGDFLTKPVDDLELLARVRNLLRVKGYHDLREKQRETLQQDLERTRGQLLHVERLSTLGTLSCAVGHELNNIA